MLKQKIDVRKTMHLRIEFMGIFFSLAVFIVGCSTHKTDVMRAVCSIDGAVEHQKIDGWGITHALDWDWEGPKRYPIPEQDVMIQIKNNLSVDLVYVYYNNLYEEINDDDDPFHYNWDSYNAQFGNHAIEFKRMRHIQRAGIEIALMGGYGKPSWMLDSNGDFDSNIPNIYDELGEYWAAFCTYAKDNYEIDVPFIVIQAEPSWHVAPNFSPTELRDAIKAVGSRLRREGFSTMILAPEDANAVATENMCQTILSDHSAKNYISNITFHGYDGISHVNGPDAAIPAMMHLANDGMVKGSGLSLWMTEWVLWYDKRMRDYIDTLRLALDFAKMVYNCHVHGNTSLYVIWSTEYDWGYDVDGSGTIENEGIFGPGVIEGSLNIKKYGHAFMQYTKYVSPGSRRIDAVISGASNVFATAYKELSAGIFTIVLINKNKHEVNLAVRINNMPGLSNLDVIRTSATENSVKLGAIDLTNNEFTTTLPDSSVTTFTGHFKTF